MVDEKIEALKFSIGSILGITASFFGETHKHIIALIILMCIDTIFGWVKGFKNGNWKSKKARWGIAGKIVELILISLLYILNWIFEVNFIVYIGLYYFIAVEIASILENYAEINGNLPNGLVDVLKKLQFNIGTAFVQKIKDFLDKVFENKGGSKNE